jgi:acyl-CoA dehydrogenase
MTITTEPPAAISQSETELRNEVRAICARFPDAYWRDLDLVRGYPDAFVAAFTEAGLLGALIPAEYGGRGMTLRQGSIILEEINRSGGHSAACHAQMYTMGALLRHGSEEQKQRYLPEIAAGRLRLQAFSVTEPEAGSDTTRIATRAVRDGDHYVITGHKNWTSRIEQTDLALVLTRTDDRADAEADRAKGLSLFLVDLREVRELAPETLRTEPVRTMFNYATNQVWYQEMRVPAAALIGVEGEGFGYVLDGWNAERILLAAEAVGDGDWFLERASDYVRDLDRFGRKLGSFQGVQFPLAQAYAQVRAADLMRFDAADRFDAGEACGLQANMAKLLASDASWAAANAAVDSLGGNGFVDAYDVERKFRETRMYRVAPVGSNLILSFLATKGLGLPRSN